jgi:hypothetical protein
MIDHFFTCGRKVHIRQMEDQARQLAGQPAAVRDAEVERFLAMLGAHADMALQFAFWLKHFGLIAEAEHVRRLTWERCVDQPEVAIEQSEELLAKGKAVDVLARLEGLTFEPDEQGVDARTHVHHLRGLASVMLGDLSQALKEFRSAKKVGNRKCDVSHWIEVLEEVRARKPRESAASDSIGVQLVRAIRAADSAGDGNAEAIRRQLDCGAVWQGNEVQSLGRLADAFLKTGVAEAGSFPMRRACAAFAGAMEDTSWRKDLFFIPGAWPQAQLEDVSRRARAWLDQESGES